MHRGSNGYWVQDYAGESVPAAIANGQEVQRRIKLAQDNGWSAANAGDVMQLSDGEIEVAASLQRTRKATYER